MKSVKDAKYHIIVGGWILLLVILMWLFSTSGNNDATITSHKQHLVPTLNQLIIKTVFIFVIIQYLLPLLSQKRNLPLFIVQILGWLTICLISEYYLLTFVSRSAIHEIHTHGAFNKNTLWWLNLLAYLFILLCLFAWHFTKEWIKNEKLKRELIQTQFSTELLFLKNQVNPHFLFNTLNNLFSIAQRNQDIETATGLSQLAGLMRYMIYDSSGNRISLEKELKNIYDFIALSKLRYQNDEVIVEVETKGGIEKMNIAPMILMPFVENSFKHGIHIEEKSIIRISISIEGNMLYFDCSNPIVENPAIQHIEYGGIGLENVRRRLVLLYPQKHVLNITTSDCTFTVHLELTT